MDLHKLEIVVAKLVPHVGSFSFRNLPQRGWNGSTNNVGKYHIIRITDSAATTGASSPASKNTPFVSDQCVAHYENRDSDGLSQSGGPSSTDHGGEDNISHIPNPAATTGSVELASPAFNSTSSASDQSVRPSALLGNKDNGGQPPPDRSPSVMELAETPRQAEGRLLPSSVAIICLFVNCKLCLAPVQIRNNASLSLTANANTLLLFMELFGVAGFLLCMVALFLKRRRKASALMAVMGCVTSICGWLTVALWALPISASPFALKEFV